MNSKYSLLISDCILINNQLFFFARNCNALCSIGLKDKAFNLLGRIPDEDVMGAELVSNIHCYKSAIYLTPKKMKAKKVWLFDLKLMEWDYIEVLFDQITHPMEKIAYSSIYKNSLIMIGSSYKGIISINLDNRAVNYFCDVPCGLNDIYSMPYCLSDGDYLYIPSPNNNSVTKLDLISFKTSVFDVGDAGYSYLGICKSNDSFWLAPRKNLPVIVKWDGEINYEEYIIPESVKSNGDYLFAHISCINEKMYMIGGRYGKKSAIFNTKSSTFEIMPYSMAFIKLLDYRSTIYQEYNGQILYKQGDVFLALDATISIDELSSSKFGEAVCNDVITELTRESIKMYIDFVSGM